MGTVADCEMHDLLHTVYISQQGTMVGGGVFSVLCMY